MSVFHNISSYLYSANSREKGECTASFFCARISASVANQDQHDITGMLAAWNGGDADALDRLIDLVYPELRRIARQYPQHRRPGESLESAALANEAYLKLVRSGGIRC
jgi:hypothetical protein